MHGTSKAGVLRVAIMFAIATAAFLTVGAAQAFAAGTLEICKSSKNGMAGREFQYTIDGGAALTVKGGRCSGPLQVASGNVLIRELQSDPATDVSLIQVRPSSRLVGGNLESREVTVKVLEGSTAANETRVTFYNEPAGGNYGDLKVCKESETAAYWGRGFSFRVNDGAAFSVEAGAPGESGSCRLIDTYQVGSRVTVQELIPAGSEIAWIDVSDGRDLAVDRFAGTALVEIGPGVTIVTYDNEPVPPAGDGFIEVCKDRALLDWYHEDEEVQGLFYFTIEDANGDVQNIEVYAGQCSEPLLVAAGVVRVTEQARAGFRLVDIWTAPEDRELAQNLINRTVDVEVPVSDDPADETVVHFVNERERAQLKICKRLASNSSALAGLPFLFHISLGSDSMNNTLIKREPFQIIAGAAGTTQCRFWPYPLPIGETVSVSEDLTNYPNVDASGEGTITINPGVNIITVTNTAMGYLEVCKLKVKDINDDKQPTFMFKIDGGTAFPIKANKCAPPRRVPVGQHTVEELSLANYELVEITTSPAGRLKSTQPSLISDASPSNGGKATVDVVYGGIADETIVFFRNRVKQFTFKICKRVSAGSLDLLAGQSFQFDWFTEKPAPSGGRDNLMDGECSSIHGPYNVLAPDATTQVVAVNEQLLAHYHVESIVYQGTGSVLQNTPATGQIRFTPGVGQNVVTYTNKAGARPA